MLIPMFLYLDDDYDWYRAVDLINKPLAALG
jgi:hypothetical protein